MENKTALQELIEIIQEERKTEYHNYVLNFVYQKAIDLLEKEKEQMIEFGEKMQIIDDVDYDGFVTFFYEPEDYYNKTYNK